MVQYRVDLTDFKFPAKTSAFFVVTWPGREEQVFITVFDELQPFISSFYFDVPTPGSKVDFYVFDIRGRRVRTLYSGTPGVGSHRLSWDGRSDSGSPLGSGVYFLVFNAPGYRQNAKLVLLK